MAHHKNMNQLPNPIPNDLKQVEELIKERYARLSEIDTEIKLKQSEKAAIRADVTKLQNVGRKLLMITPSKPKEEPIN